MESTHPVKSVSHPLMVAVILISLFISACVSTQKIKRPTDPGNGFVEFYCMRCMTGWAVFLVDGEGHLNLGQQILGRRLKDSIETPSRLRIIRIALPAGEYQFLIRLLPFTRIDSLFDVKDGSSRQLELTVTQNSLSPVRINFNRTNTNSFDWQVKESAVIPMRENPDTIETLTIFLKSTDWDTRWYATQVLGEIQGDLPQLALVRLKALSGKDALKNCLKKSTVVECETLRDAALKTLKGLVKNHP